MRRSTLLLIVLCAFGFLLTGCKKDEVRDLPSGEQTVSGVLRSAEISITRRGTHIIDLDGIDVYYAESSVVNLRDYQGKHVTLLGVLEHNIDPNHLPVLVVASVEDVEETVREYHFRLHDLTLEAPVHWSVKEEDGQIQFLLENTTNPVLTIFSDAGEDLPVDGVPIVVDATRAVRLVDELTGNQIVSVKRDSDILTFLYSPADAPNPEALREAWLQLLNSVSLDDDSGSGGTSTGTGALGVPCGGAAGILCSSGYYCDVQDLQENIGRCRKI